MSRAVLLSGDLEMPSLILCIQHTHTHPPLALPVWSQDIRRGYRSREYLEEELPPAIVPSLWLNEVGKSEKLIPAETLGIIADREMATS